MNFTLVSPGDVGYNRIMMQRHLDNKRKVSKENIPQIVEPSDIPANDKIANEGLPRAGKSILNNSWMADSGYSYNCSSPKRETNEENQKMKRLYQNELRETLLDQMNRKNQQNEENRKMSKVMAVENGMLDYLQKEI